MKIHPIMIDANTNLTLTANYNDEDTLEKLKRARQGSHDIIVYSDLPSLRQIHSQHIKREIEEKKEIVLILPHHETIDMYIRQTFFVSLPKDLSF